jgi:hypothetical protein
MAVIGKNLNDKLTSGDCTRFHGQGGNLPATTISGTISVRPAGQD